MFVFVIDRFVAVFWTYGYPKHSTKIMIILSLSTWVFALVWRVLALPGILTATDICRLPTCAFIQHAVAKLVP